MWRASLAQKEDGASKQRGQPGILRQSIGSPFICMRVCLTTPRTVVAHNPAELTSKADAQHTWQRSSACRELCAALRPQTPPRRQTAKRQVQSGPEEWSGRGMGLEDARLRLDRLIHRLNDAPFILRHRAEQTNAHETPHRFGFGQQTTRRIDRRLCSNPCDDRFSRDCDALLQRRCGAVMRRDSRTKTNWMPNGRW